MTSVSARYEEAVRLWHERGRPAPEPDAWTAMIASCWMHSAGGRHDGASDRVRDFVAALREAAAKKNADWLDDLFDGHEYCTFCSQSWRAENCGYCTNCLTAYPPCCGDKRGLRMLPNGNFECGTCRHGEIVG